MPPPPSSIAFHVDIVRTCSLSGLKEIHAGRVNPFFYNTEMVKTYVRRREKEAAAELKLLLSLARGKITIPYDLSNSQWLDSSNASRHSRAG